MPASSVTSLRSSATRVSSLTRTRMPTSKISLIARILVRRVGAVTGNVTFYATIVAFLLIVVVASILVPIMEAVLISRVIVVIESLATSAAHETPTTIIVIRIEAVHVTTTTTIVVAVTSASTTSLIIAILMVIVAWHTLIHASSIAPLIMIFSLTTVVRVVLTLLWIGRPAITATGSVKII